MRGWPRLQNELVKQDESEIFDLVILTGHSGRPASQFGDLPVAMLLDPLHVPPQENEKGDGSHSGEDQEIDLALDHEEEADSVEGEDDADSVEGDEEADSVAGDEEPDLAEGDEEANLREEDEEVDPMEKAESVDRPAAFRRSRRLEGRE
jgi:hypothetical protein